MNPAFVVALLLLGAAALLSGPGADWLNLKQGKLALPLVVPLDRLADAALAPYRVVERHILDPAVVDALGTDQYLSWSLEDGSAAPNDPLRRANLLITYYTGGGNLVPHTPDVCYLGLGYTPAQPHENQELDAGSAADGPKTIPIRICTFVKTAVHNHEKISVVYTFRCNGEYKSTRTGVRLAINNPFNSYAYFSKVEVGFPGATREQSIAGAGKLFRRLLPVLSRDHWPDFEAAEEAARREDAEN